MAMLVEHFTDENGIHFIHSPRFDVTGYGYSIVEAIISFIIVHSDFVEALGSSDDESKLTK